MISISQLRVFSRLFLNMITRDDMIKIDDIRYVKDGSGTMPTRLINEVNGTTKEVPYLNDDEFIVFDVIVNNNIASEVIDGKFKSHMPFTIVVNIYGDSSSDELQHMMSRISTFSVRNYLRKNNMSIMKEKIILACKLNLNILKIIMLSLFMN